MSSMSLSNNQKNELLFVGFNQDYGCFACGTDTGFRIYNVDPFRETFRRVFSNGGIGIVEMLFRCNLLALVGGGRNPRYPPNKVMIWDDHQSRCIGELSFRSEVKAVRLRRDRVVVVLAQRIYVYRFSDLHLLDRINTIRNDQGLVALCADASNMVLACPGVSRGHVNVELYDLRRSTLIPAHESELAQLALSMDGKMVATASSRGTLLRVFDTDTGSLLHELRRGMDRAEVTSICFNQQSTFVACCSDRGTVHIFSLEPGTSNGTGGPGGGGMGSGGGVAPDESPRIGGGGGARRSMATGATLNAMSGLRFIGGLVPGLPAYFNSEWSYAQIRGIEARSVCAFGREPRTIVLISEDGSFLTARFSEPGECERISYARFLRGASGGSDDEGDEDIARAKGEGGGGGGGGGDRGAAGGGGGGAFGGGMLNTLGQPSSSQTPTSLTRRPSEPNRPPPPPRQQQQQEQQRQQQAPPATTTAPPTPVVPAGPSGGQDMSLSPTTPSTAAATGPAAAAGYTQQAFGATATPALAGPPAGAQGAGGVAAASLGAGQDGQLQPAPPLAKQQEFFDEASGAEAPASAPGADEVDDLSEAVSRTAL
eukprot:g19047.t1